MKTLREIIYRYTADGKVEVHREEPLEPRSWTQRGEKTFLLSDGAAIDITHLMTGDLPKFAWVEA